MIVTSVPGRRVFRDCIDHANFLCMEIRAKKLREEYAQHLRRTMRAIPYQVHYGVMQQNTQHFADFGRALDFLKAHVDDDFAPMLVGASFDGERSGLTEDERDLVAAVLDARAARNAGRS